MKLITCIVFCFHSKTNIPEDFLNTQKANVKRSLSSNNLGLSLWHPSFSWCFKDAVINVKVFSDYSVESFLFVSIMNKKTSNNICSTNTVSKIPGTGGKCDVCNIRWFVVLPLKVNHVHFFHTLMVCTSFCLVFRWIDIILSLKIMTVYWNCIDFFQWLTLKLKIYTVKPSNSF